jgi:tetratricopeptide (TPR) repeat protein
LIVNEPEPPREPLHDGQDGEVDADFLYHLYRGGELLAGGKNLEARDELERASHLKPRDEKGQNLLGLVYFKLGLLDRAIEIYDRLVQDNPGDATLRTNLGLVHLKAGQIPQAIQQLEAAIEVLPDHSKALNYLGLAYAQAHDHQRARHAFERAGNEAMARKQMTRSRRTRA